MAVMIPSVISPDVKSDAEKRIFRWFKEAPGTEDWIVLHSLGLAYHSKLIHGETDFLVLAPHLGIFALEVKGGQVKRSADGIWTFINRYGKETRKERGPFDQAWEGIHSIVEFIHNRLDSSHWYLKQILFGIGVMMPDIKYDAQGIDEHQWQVFDIMDAQKGHDVAGFIRRLSDGAKDDWSSHYKTDVTKKLPDRNDVEYLKSLLRNEFDSVIPLNLGSSKASGQQIELTKEQYGCLDQLEDNNRLLIPGGAGTGKTMLAIEAARRFTANGERVALLCYNRTLGTWLRGALKDVKCHPAFVGTLHSWMSSVIPEDMSEDTASEQEWFEDILPNKVIRKLEQEQPPFDRIIIDEAQDLIRPVYLQMFHYMLAGGFRRGKWVMLGDFSMQAIYDDELNEEKLIELLQDQTSFAIYRLRINCRNTVEICDDINLVTESGMKCNTAKAVSGPKPDWDQWTDREEEKKKLEERLSTLINNGVSMTQVVILSPVSYNRSVASQIQQYKIEQYVPGKKTGLTFSTIHSFKGLESQFVILTDLESVTDKRMLYVAMSRARYGLYILADEKTRNEYLQLYIRRMFS